MKHFKSFIIDIIVPSFKLIPCILGFHKWKYYVYNIKTECDNTVTFSFKDCNKCGASKIIFFYGNE
jgi:hypothetical protein